MKIGNGAERKGAGRKSMGGVCSCYLPPHGHAAVDSLCPSLHMHLAFSSRSAAPLCCRPPLCSFLAFNAPPLLSVHWASLLCRMSVSSWPVRAADCSGRVRGRRHNRDCQEGEETTIAGFGTRSRSRNNPKIIDEEAKKKRRRKQLQQL